MGKRIKGLRSSPVEMPVFATPDSVALADLPSIGSLGHFAGQCSRCCFHPKGRCQNGYDCRFCHFDHEKRQRKKKTTVAREWGAYNRNSNPRAPPGLEGVAHWDQSVATMPGQYPAYPFEAIPVNPQAHPLAPPALEVPLGSQDVNSWSIDQVSGWLGSIGFGHLAEAFQAHRITGDVLQDLSLNDLAEIGVLALGDKKRLLRAVQQLRPPQMCQPPLAPPCQDLFMQQPCPSPLGCPPAGCPPAFPQCYASPPPPLASGLAPAFAPNSAPQWI